MKTNTRTKQSAGRVNMSWLVAVTALGLLGAQAYGGTISVGVAEGDWADTSTWAGGVLPDDRAVVNNNRIFRLPDPGRELEGFPGK
jgi:hypothetical protein